MKIGFIGVGNMGGPMCRNIIKNTNHEVVVFDLNPAAVKECTDLGASAGARAACSMHTFAGGRSTRHRCSTGRRVACSARRI